MGAQPPASTANSVVATVTLASCVPSTVQSAWGAPSTWVQNPSVSGSWLWRYPSASVNSGVSSAGNSFYGSHMSIPNHPPTNHPWRVQTSTHLLNGAVTWSAGCVTTPATTRASASINRASPAFECLMTVTNAGNTYAAYGKKIPVNALVETVGRINNSLAAQVVTCPSNPITTKKMEAMKFAYNLMR